MVRGLDPLMFLSLAEELAEATEDEVRLRTAVNRAYYAMFLLARTKTGATEVAEGAHSAVRRLLRQRGYTFAAEKLTKLYNLRILADYKLDTDPDQEDWQNIWVVARQLAQDIQVLVKGMRVGRLPKNFS